MANKISWTARIVLFFTVFITSFFYYNYGKETYLFTGDSLGYYSYLPSLFIYDNFYSIEKLPHDKGIERPVLEYVARYPNEQTKTSKGTYINQYTYGVAAFEMPFFLIAHLYEKLSGGKANGYSISYHHALKVAFLIFGLLGMFFLYKVVNLFFSRDETILGICSILLGTNLFWFVFVQGGMAHSILFMLYSLLIYLTVLLHKNPKNIYFVATAFIAGIITVIRPSDVICILIPILYGIYSIETLREKWIFIVKYKYIILLSLFVFALPIIPQLVFWKKYAGSFIYYSYGQQSFDWLHPKVLQGLFGFKNGWLPYSPIIIFSLIGLFFANRKFPELKLSIWLILILHIYISYSWWCYNYINGYGSRPMIHLYPLLALPLTLTIHYIRNFRYAFLKSLSAIVFVLLLVLNLSLMYKAAEGKLISEESNSTFYFSTLFKTNLSYDDLVVFDSEELQPNQNTLQVLDTISYHNFENLQDSGNHFIFDSSLSSVVCFLNEGDEFPPFPFRDTLSKNLGRAYVKVSALIRIPQYELSMYWQPILAFSLKREDSTILWKGIKVNNKISRKGGTMNKSEITFGHAKENIWGEVSFFVNLNEIELLKNDILEFGIWNRAKKPLYFDELTLETYR